MWRFSLKTANIRGDYRQENLQKIYFKAENQQA